MYVTFPLYMKQQPHHYTHECIVRARVRALSFNPADKSQWVDAQCLIQAQRSSTLAQRRTAWKGRITPVSVPRYIPAEGLEFAVPLHVPPVTAPSTRPKLELASSSPAIVAAGQERGSPSSSGLCSDSGSSCNHLVIDVRDSHTPILTVSHGPGRGFAAGTAVQ